MENPNTAIEVLTFQQTPEAMELLQRVRESLEEANRLQKPQPIPDWQVWFEFARCRSNTQGIGTSESITPTKCAQYADAMLKRFRERFPEGTV